MSAPPTQETVPHRRGMGRLAVRIYLASLIQIVMIVLTWTGVRLITEQALPGERLGLRRTTGYLLAKLAELRDDPPALQHEMKRMHDEVGRNVSLYTLDGKLIATNVDPPLATLEPADKARVLRDGSITLGSEVLNHVAAPILDPQGKVVGYGVTAPVHPFNPSRGALPTIAIILLCLAVGSVVFARNLARPLERLSRVARSFGAGQLSARARLDRHDEFGDLSHAFDEMADRVESLLRSQKELLANVSHELRTPLARIRVALDIAAEGDTELARESLADITEDLGELERLVDDVLTAARLDLSTGASPPLRREPIELGALIEKAAAKFRGAHPGRQLAVTLAPALPSLEADPTLLRRVVDNLLDNARKYSDADRPVTLRARADGSDAVVEVEDRGIGIDEADMKNLFTPFFRTDKSRARSTGGVGLGLALARRIVEAHGGTIAVDSKAGVGTTVRFTVPAELHTS